ncbi:hypothetical protein HMPREF0216_03183 [Clostridium celatum DSM 1785]|uniref:Uncharacterized protein n=2 Tax=Clostridium celatum TaxID=36834 RepID=L1Q4Q0_9CLOT|nr:hypothetical protein HMPREF0216_03183 [Clostridium celatum DSM 1785]
MSKMKISINTGNKKIYIPVSFSLASAFVMMIPSKEISKEDKKTILSILKVCKKELKPYKGLEIINVNSASGEKIIIKI